ncbi:MAG: excisionase family DNA-binding protein [Actinobacteria bacterium]|nr:excisionase family DNA-binding protein [Actinomycetota bacterium]
MLGVRPVKHHPVLLSISDAAVHLGVTERYIRRLVYERRVPFYKVGRLVRFREAELDQWLEASRVEASIGARHRQRPTRPSRHLHRPPRRHRQHLARHARMTPPETPGSPV